MVSATEGSLYVTGGVAVAYAATLMVAGTVATGSEMCTTALALAPTLTVSYTYLKYRTCVCSGITCLRCWLIDI
jgi:hypothetical protein